MQTCPQCGTTWDETVIICDSAPANASDVPASTETSEEASASIAEEQTAAAETPPVAWLRPVDGGPATRISSATFIGRVAECQLVIDDPAVSRRHCVIFLSASGARLEDLASSNGTSVNDRPVEKSPIADGDIIQIAGRHRLRFQSQPDAQNREKTLITQRSPAAI